MSDHLAEIRARLDAMPTDRPWHVIEVSALIPHVRADIAWLLAEWERLTARVRIYEDVKS